MSATERMELAVKPETKKLAELASVALGCASITEYVTRLIHANAPATLKQQPPITLSEAEFDRFWAACQDESASPSARILEAAERLDREGF